MRLSVVVAAFSGDAALLRCLESLAAQPGVGEIVVASASGLPAVAAGFTRLRFVPAPRDASVFELRSSGLALAQGDAVAITEDHCVPGADWARALLDAHAAGHAVVGGPVEPAAGLGFSGRALHLCEYAAHLPPLAEGPAEILSGVNVSYLRTALERCRDVWAEAFYENEVHDALRAQGVTLYRASEAVVTAHLAFPLAAAMRHLQRGGRRFGGYRVRGATPLRRALLRLAAPLVPVVLLWRLLRIVSARRPAWLPFTLRALPYSACLVGAWSWGEALGYWSAWPGGRRGR